MSPAPGVDGMAFLRRPGRLLICRPNPIQFGHLGMEMVMALARAREEGSAIAFLRQRPVVNEGPFDLESDEVEIRRLSAPAAAWWRLWWACGTHRGDLADRILDLRIAFWKQVGETARRLVSRPGLSPGAVDRLRRLKTAAREREPERRPRSTPYLKRRLIRTPVRVRFRRDVDQRLVRLAAEVGIARDRPVVTVHAREPGWKRGREVQDKPPSARQYMRDDSTRNADIETFVPAIDYLVERGFTVVRLGDPSMRAVVRPGVIDLALNPRRTPALDVYCLLQSRFLLAGESGPSVVTLLTNTPTLTINATDPVSSYPIRADWLFVPKAVIERATGRQLMLRQMATEQYLAAVRNTTQYEYVSNTPEEILEATVEMLAFLESPPPETDEQRCFRELLARLSIEMAPLHRYVRKWAAHEGFLGDGRVARFYADRYFG
ncbi:MAG: TIGR04372 family glycosyltransferase [Acidobacteria bacterium]|nr:TIGR04372 family glycosyltransferase [Acidobacteriota bacterium]